MRFYAEVDTSEEGMRLIRVHRNWVGRRPKGTATHTFEDIDVPDYESDDPQLFGIELQSDEAPEGQSCRLQGGLVLTSTPEQYGDPDAREAAGKHKAVRLRFEEWVLV